MEPSWSLRACGILLPPRRARPLPPPDSLRSVDTSALGWFWAFPARVAEGVKKPPHVAEIPAPGTKPGLPSIARREGSGGCRALQIAARGRSASRLVAMEA